jgi:sarcosine oxidase, subunit beta
VTGADDWAAVAADVAAQQADGLPVALVDAVAARAAVPGLTPECAGAIVCPIDGQAEAMAVVRAYAAAARRVGVQIIEGAEVMGLSGLAGHIDGVLLANGERLACEVAIVAAGAWTAPLLAPLGVDLPIRARALQMLLTTPGAPGLGPVLGRVGRPLSLKQLSDGAYLIGGGWPAEIVDEGGNHWRLIEASIEGNLAVARRTYPPLAGLDLARGWAGIEAFLPDDLPVLGPVAGIAGLLVAAGFSGHGFALSPVVGEILARLALGGPAFDHLWGGLRADRDWSAGRAGA